MGKARETRGTHMHEAMKSEKTNNRFGLEDGRHKHRERLLGECHGRECCRSNGLRLPPCDCILEANTPVNWIEQQPPPQQKGILRRVYRKTEYLSTIRGEAKTDTSMATFAQSPKPTTHGAREAAEQRTT